MGNKIHICRLASEPNETECREVIASDGRACKQCDIDCYRQGWSKEKVTLDNKKLVQIKRGQMGNEKICKNCKNWDETFTRTSKKHPFGYCNGKLVVNAEPPESPHTRKGKIYIGWGKLAELGDDFIIQFRDDFSCEYFKARAK